MQPEVPYLDAHHEVAAALYRQRKLWLKQEETGAHSIANLEHRQRVHIHVLSHIIDPDEEVPDKEHELFVYLARRLQSDDQDSRSQGYELTREYLAGDSSQQRASYQALLNYPQNHNDDLIKLFHENEEIQPVLFNLWRDQSVLIDTAIINAAVHNSNPDIVLAALRYAADRKEFGRDVFNIYLDKLSPSYDQSSIEARLLEPALWGNMLRNDPDINKKIRLAIENTSADSNEKNTNERIIRLAALSGEQGLFPIVEAWALSQPDPGLFYLALSGRKEAVQVLLEYLEKGRDSDIASRAWTWITGQTLPMIPRMQVVTEEGEQALGTAADVPLQPDYSQAALWWREHKDHWSNDVRIIAGETLSADILLKLAKQTCGLAGKDYRDLLALKLGRPLGISQNVWIINQEAVFKQLATQNHEQPATGKMVSHA